MVLCLDNCWVKISEIVKMVNISDEFVFNILYAHLDIRNYQQDECHIYFKLITKQNHLTILKKCFDMLNKAQSKCVFEVLCNRLMKYGTIIAFWKWKFLKTVYFIISCSEYVLWLRQKQFHWSEVHGHNVHRFAWHILFIDYLEKEKLSKNSIMSLFCWVFVYSHPLVKFLL